MYFPALKSPSRVHTGWASVVGQGYRLQYGGDDLREEALGFALKMMARVKEWAHRTVESLQREGYEFSEPNRVLSEPEERRRTFVLVTRSGNRGTPYGSSQRIAGSD